MLSSTRKKIALLLCFVVFSLELAAVEFKSYKGELDAKGQAKVELTINSDKPFILQAFMLYKKSWRSIPVFFNENGVWLDMGPAYRKLDYRINFLQE